MTKTRCPTFTFAGSASLHPERLPRSSKSLANPRRLQDPITALPGVGAATAREAAKLGLHTLGDLLAHYPRRHEDCTSQRSIAALKQNDQATVACRLESIRLKPTRRRNLRLVQATVRDESGYMQAIWFNQDYLIETLSPGDQLLLWGSLGPRTTFKVSGFELLGQEEAGLHTTGLVPVYSTTEKISVKKLRGWLGSVKELAPFLVEPLPADLRARLRLPAKGDAVLAMHFPAVYADFARARRRLVFEELFLLQLGLLARRRLTEQQRRGVKLGPSDQLTGLFLASLPFELTADQQQACGEIAVDLESETPMQRLLQGDVGSGKTVVAVYALLRAVEYGLQAALMAPTEVLAEQHFLNLAALLTPLGVRLAFLSSRLSAGRRQELLEGIAGGSFDLVVGTHALIQEGVAFAGLGVVVVDEQHRFGVHQREELSARATRSGVTPHVLHMTATPIPRTLALTLYGDLEVSSIDSLPAGRRPVITRVVSEAKRALAYDFIRGQLDQGRQCFIVCPLIEESELLDAKAVAVEAERLKADEFAAYRLAVLHGQMAPAEKQAVMRGFSCGEVQVLVTTTVVEVGVDVPNATVMVVEEADRFGLAQLHQLRGRVGRGGHKSYCFLFGEGKTEAAERRLAAMAASNDGFALADMDLEIRGEGQLFGARQSGLPDLKLARLLKDQKLLGQARRQAARLIAADPQLKRPEHRLLKEAVEAAFGAAALEWLDKV